MEGYYPELWISPIANFSVADHAIFVAPTPVDIIACGVSITTAVDADADSQLSLNLDKITSGGTRGDGDVGSITGGLNTDYAIGDVLFTRRVSPDASKVDQPHELNAGEQVAFQITDVGDGAAGAGVSWVLYQRRHFDIDDVDTRTLAQGNRNANVTKFTS